MVVRPAPYTVWFWIGSAPPPNLQLTTAYQIDMTTLFWIGRHEGTIQFLGRRRKNYSAAGQLPAEADPAEILSGLRRASLWPILDQTVFLLITSNQQRKICQLILGKCLVQNNWYQPWNPRRNWFSKIIQPYGYRTIFFAPRNFYLLTTGGLLSVISFLS